MLFPKRKKPVVKTETKPNEEKKEEKKETNIEEKTGETKKDEKEQKKRAESLPERELDFDFLILACPLKPALSFLDSNDFEKEVFGSLQYFTFATTLYEADANPKHADSVCYYPDALTDKAYKENPGQITSIRHSKVACFDDGAKDPRPLHIGLQFLPRPLTEEEKNTNFLPRRFEEELKKKGVENVKILERDCYEYFPHFDEAGLRRNNPWRILEQQGLNHTWYIGSSACNFESVLDVVSYNQFLADQFLMKELITAK